MSMGHGYHRISETRLHSRTDENDAPAPVVTSAGALIHGLETLSVKRIALVTPYVKQLTELVIGYIEAEGFEVLDSVSLGISNNIAVGRRDPMALVEISRKLNMANVEAVVISACVQMP